MYLFCHSKRKNHFQLDTEIMFSVAQNSHLCAIINTTTRFNSGSMINFFRISFNNPWNWGKESTYSNTSFDYLFHQPITRPLLLLTAKAQVPLWCTFLRSKLNPRIAQSLITSISMCTSFTADIIEELCELAKSANLSCSCCGQLGVWNV